MAQVVAEQLATSKNVAPLELSGWQGIAPVLELLHKQHYVYVDCQVARELIVTLLPSKEGTAPTLFAMPTNKKLVVLTIRHKMVQISFLYFYCLLINHDNTEAIRFHPQTVRISADQNDRNDNDIVNVSIEQISQSLSARRQPLVLVSESKSVRTWRELRVVAIHRLSEGKVELETDNGERIAYATHCVVWFDEVKS